MALALPADLIAATVQVEQVLPNGGRTIGTGFLVNDPTPDGRPRTVLVTANHVFSGMPGVKAHIGYRLRGKDGAWTFDPQPLTIRGANNQPLWRRHPSRDVAAIVVKAPPAFAKAAIPLAWLAGDDTLSRADIGPGDEMMVLGYPQGLSANAAGFPILRSGRVASPIDASSVSPTFLLDFRVFPGNSGGPVFISDPDRRDPASDAAAPAQFVAGMLTQQVELNHERLEIGIVTEAAFIRDTLALLDRPSGAPGPAPAADPPAAKIAAATQPAAQPSKPSQPIEAIVGTAVNE
jgi:S1-C subfamily serine protease